MGSYSILFLSYSALEDDSNKIGIESVFRSEEATSKAQGKNVNFIRIEFKEAFMEFLHANFLY